MRVVADLEANGLRPTKIWCLVAKDVDTGAVYQFEDVTNETFQDFASKVQVWIGHNFLGYDAPVLRSLCHLDIPLSAVIDTLVISRLLDSTRKRHGLEAWGEDLRHPKLHTDISDWETYDPRMLERCVSDVELNYLLFKKFEKYLSSPRWEAALRTEHFIADLCRTLHDNGFAFNRTEAETLHAEIKIEVDKLETDMKSAFGLRVVPGKEVTPRETKHGTLSRSNLRWAGDDLTSYSSGASFTRIDYEEFNAASHTQRLRVLWEAGWQPINKTKSHYAAEKRYNELRRKRKKSPADWDEIKSLPEILGEYGVSGYGYSGWMTDEENLNTLPETAPQACHSLARFLLLNNRLSTLESWIKACEEDGRIHGSFNNIGAWTQRMSHDRPNMGNIPKFDPKQPQKTPYSDRMRSLWQADHGRYLVGVDAESIQLRIFGHYIDDEEFIQSLLKGDKATGTDPHSVNQRALGAPCKSRDDAKTFIYAWLLGAGIAKVAAILGCSREEASIAVDNFVQRYTGLKYLKEDVIPYDAERGYFEGFDGRFVRIRGDDVDSRRHYCLGGYLQNGEKLIMSRAAELWVPRLNKEKIPFWPVNFVHDEFQIETVRDMDTAIYVASTVADAIREAGASLNLRCPMAGSFQSDHGTLVNGQKLAIGDNWYVTH